MRAALIRALTAAAVTVLAACSSTPHRSSSYREDGPPARVPDLSQTPDAVPRIESLNPYANRPYVALGRTYLPETAETPFHQRGVASWYGRQFHGNRTASGERYDMFAMTAAHPTLPIPCYVRVTNVRDGRSVIVRVNDRGPFYKDRIIDLSYAAASKLGLAVAGSGEVDVDRILPAQVAAGAASPACASARTGKASDCVAQPAPGPDRAVVAANQAAPAPPVADAIPPSTERSREPIELAAALPVAPAGGSAVTKPLPDAPLIDRDPIEQLATDRAPAATAQTATPAAPAPPEGTLWAVQLGAFAFAVNADALRDRIALLLNAPDASGLPTALRSPRVQSDGSFSRVLVGSVADRALAVQWARMLERFLQRPTALFAY
jgi:rare lipoprotein A